MGKTAIEWCDSVWNPTRGCSRVSPGCGGAKGEGGCYAERQAIRMSAPGGKYYGLVRNGKQGPRWTGTVQLIPGKLEEPLRWKKPQRIFVNSMSDLFHEYLTNEEIAAVFGIMAAAPQHTFQILTKRAKRMREWFDWVASLEKEGGPPPDVVVSTCASNYVDCDQLQRPWPLRNVWLGVSVENQQCADERIPILRKTPAAVRFVSAEPLLGPLSLFGSPDDTGDPAAGWNVESVKRLTDYGTGVEYDVDLQAGIDWCIVGGESGPGARDFEIEWATSLIEQCKRAQVACFLKQLGRRPTIDGTPVGYGDGSDGTPGWVEGSLRDSHGGDWEEWPESLRVRQFPEAACAG